MANGRDHGPRDRIASDFLRRCIRAPEAAFKEVESYREPNILHDVYRTACIQKTEPVLEPSGELLRNRFANELGFTDLFRHATRHRLIAVEAAKGWLTYRGAVASSRSALPPAPSIECFRCSADSLRAAIQTNARAVELLVDLRHALLPTLLSGEFAQTRSRVPA